MGGCFQTQEGSVQHVVLLSLQVAVGLRSQAFVNKVEVWWGPTTSVQSGQADQPPQDGPLLAIRVSFTGDKEPEVMISAQNASAACAAASGDCCWCQFCIMNTTLNHLPPQRFRTLAHKGLIQFEHQHT